MTKQYDSCVDWLENMMRILDKRVMADLITTLWNCWNSRNNFIFKGKEDNVQTIWDRASNLVNENRMGYEVIIRDDDGFVLGGGGGFMDTKISAQEAECIAFERSIKLASHLNINDDVLI
ncbi:hypothetical protein PVK06_005628 [Gossypium arboreum]|uniref:RNase H type-1 domain-containing protein n=1 Tax=Gossypium arboreum TaxID=29729 RepID=A0ABR0QW26_GOSAR|nr:hypothetical protein PVK06_005628 [Gossypium arboreum]